MDGDLTKMLHGKLSCSQSRASRYYSSTSRQVPLHPGTEFTPKRNNRTQGYVEGCSFTKLKEFNPSSRDHIAWILTNYDNFTIETTTTSGKTKIDETILKNHGTGLSQQF